MSARIYLFPARRVALGAVEYDPRVYPARTNDAIVERLRGVEGLVFSDGEKFAPCFPMTDDEPEETA